MYHSPLQVISEHKVHVQTLVPCLPSSRCYKNLKMGLNYSWILSIWGYEPWNCGLDTELATTLSKYCNFAVYMVQWGNHPVCMIQRGNQPVCMTQRCNHPVCMTQRGNHLVCMEQRGNHPVCMVQWGNHPVCIMQRGNHPVCMVQRDNHPITIKLLDFVQKLNSNVLHTIVRTL
jgi:hypothetical protein